MRKTELAKILEWHKSGTLKTDEAVERIFSLFGVVGRSEQLVCNCQGCGDVKKIEYCEKCYAENLPDLAN